MYIFDNIIPLTSHTSMHYKYCYTIFVYFVVLERNKETKVLKCHFYINNSGMFAKSSIGQLCLKITSEIFDDPVSEIFRIPAFQSQNDPYLDVIKNPMDLGTIKKKIKDSSYRSFGDWKEDVELVFNNAIEYNGEMSIIGGMAVYLRKEFNKMLDRYHILNKQNYEERLRSLYRQLQEELDHLYTLQLDKTLTPKYTTKDLVNMLSSLNDTSEVEEILKKHGYESLIKKGKSNLNLDDLKRECLDDMYRYITTPRVPQ